MMIWQSGMIIEGSTDRMISTGTNWNKGSDLVNRFVPDQRLVDQVLQKSGVDQTPGETLPSTNGNWEMSSFIIGSAPLPPPGRWS